MTVLSTRIAGLRPARSALLIGVVLAGVAQLGLPDGRPLFDGLSTVAPYRFLNPPSGQFGSPSSYAGDVAVSNGQSPQFTAATSENPPQAQLIALAGAFSVPSGTAKLHISITPIESASLPPAGRVSGNVYRIAVTDANGQPVPVAAGQSPTLAMRSPGGDANGVIFRLSNGTWQQLDTAASSSLALYTAQVDGLGDFAVVDLGTGITVTTLVVTATVLIVVLAIGLWAVRLVMRRRALATEAAARDRQRGSRGRSSGRSGRRQPPRKR